MKKREGKREKGGGKKDEGSGFRVQDSRFWIRPSATTQPSTSQPIRKVPPDGREATAGPKNGQRCRPAKRLPALAAVAVLLLSAAEAQTFRRAGTEFNANRPVSVAVGKSCSVVVTEFFHHGQITSDGRNVIVAARSGELAPMRVLQLGPGDLCRLAFEPIERQRDHEILYGGDPPEQPPPPLTSRDGLLLETRRYKSCNLASLDSLRDAFNSSQPFGADYVDNVFHAHNPFSLKPEPFLSRYNGYLHLDRQATYGFLTASRDASFLLIDDELVVAAPGRHSPARRALRGSRKDVVLRAGAHKFEYYHAATSSYATMSAAWEIDPTNDKPQPKQIPSEMFNTQRVIRLPAGRLTLRSSRSVPDFLVKITGDVPLPDNRVPLIAVSFRDASPRTLSMQAKVRWDFGDGQTGERLNTDHVYLRPGLYAVTLSLRHGTRSVAMTNRIYVDRPVLDRKEKLHSLDEYLDIVESYNPGALDAESLLQLALAYEAKALQLVDLARKPEGAAGVPVKMETPPEALEYFAASVTAGKVAFIEESTAQGDAGLLKIARLIGPMARDRLGDSQMAARIWWGAAKRINVPGLKAECEIESADIAVNDLLNTAAAKTLLDAATEHLGSAARGTVAARLQRVRGDYHAATGNGESARTAYNEAQRLLGPTRRYIEQTAWQGAHSRSTEEFIREGDFLRAARQLQRWQAEFPTAKIDGYVTLLFARYWAGREQYAPAIAQAEQLQAVNPDSPYVDQLLMLAADCELRRGRTDRALATLHSLLQDHPGSPLVPEARKKIEQLETKPN